MLAYTYNPSFIHTTYTTLKKHKPLSSLVLNHRKFIETIKPNLKPVCACKLEKLHKHITTKEHLLVMPFEMPMKEEDTLRNLQSPIADTQAVSFYSIASSFLRIIVKLNLFQRTEMPFKITFNANDAIFTCSLYKLHFSSDITRFGCFVVMCKLLNNPDIQTITSNIYKHLQTVNTLKQNTPPLVSLIVSASKEQGVAQHNQPLFKALLKFLSSPNHIANYNVPYNTITFNKIAFNFILEYNLLNAPFARTFAPKFLKLLNTSLSPCNDAPFTGSTLDVRDLLSKHPGFLWLPIDKNTRKAARLCPKRLFNEVKTFFLKDKVTYTIISDNNEDEEQFVKTI